MNAIPINNRMDLREWLLLVLLSMIWGGSFFLMEVAVAELPPLTIVAARVTLAAATLWAVCLIRRKRLPVQASIWLAFLFMGVLNNAVPFSLIVWGQTQIASSLASILNATTPLFTVVIAHRFLADERMTPAKMIGIVLGVAGVALMLLPSLALGQTGELTGQIAVLGAALSYGLATVFGRRFRRLGVSPFATATGQLTCASLVLIPLSSLIDQPWQQGWPTPGITLALIVLAVVCTALAYLLYFHILASAGATNIALVTLLVPVSASLLGVLILNESLTGLQLAGLASIATGLSVIDGRLWQRRHR